MQDAVIIGAGGLGREVAEWICDLNDRAASYRIVGFLDDDVSKHGTERNGVSVLGGIDWLAHHSRPLIAFLALGNPGPKRRVLERMRRYSLPFGSLIHPTAVVGRAVSIGEGVIIGPTTVVTTNVHIGAFVTVNYGVTIGHDARVDEFATLAPGVNVSGFVHIGAGADVGAGTSTIPSVEIGEWTVVGAGAAVTRSLPANCTAVGVPARVIKQRAPGWQV